MTTGVTTRVRIGGKKNGVEVAITGENGRVKITPTDHPQAKDALDVLLAHLQGIMGGQDVWEKYGHIILEIPERAANQPDPQLMPINFENVQKECERIADSYTDLSSLAEGAKIIRARSEVTVENIQLSDVEVTNLLKAVKEGLSEPEAEEKKIPADAPASQVDSGMGTVGYGAANWIRARAAHQAVIDVLQAEGIVFSDAIGLQVTIANAKPSERADAVIAHIEAPPSIPGEAPIKLTDDQKERLKDALRRVKTNEAPNRA